MFSALDDDGNDLDAQREPGNHGRDDSQSVVFEH